MTHDFTKFLDMKMLVTKQVQIRHTLSPCFLKHKVVQKC